VILPAASFSTLLSDLNPVFAAVAAVAAVIALYFARKRSSSPTPQDKRGQLSTPSRWTE